MTKMRFRENETDYFGEVHVEHVILNVVSNPYYRRSNIALNSKNLEGIIHFLENSKFPLKCLGFTPETLSNIGGSKTFAGRENPFQYKDGILFPETDCINREHNARLGLLTYRILSQGIEIYLKSLTPKALRYDY
jgi:hypothetical protein